jgi:tetratricopeptide (TPR) repeat protein
VERLALSPAHGYILSRIDGTSRVDDVLSLLPPGEEEVACRFLYGLLIMGVVTLDPPPGEGPFRIAAILKDHADAVALERLQEQMILEAFESFRGNSPHEVLGVRSNPRREDVERAYEDLKSRFGRDRLLPKVRDKYRAELALIEGRTLEAYLTLAQSLHGEAMRRPDDVAPAKDMGMDDLLVRVEMDKTRAKVAIEESSRQAEAYYNKARKFVREGDYHNAIQYGKLAISYAPEDARFYFLLADCQARNPEARWQRMAEQNYAKATQLDPWNAEYRITLGRFYKKRGLKLRARKQLEGLD